MNKKLTRNAIRCKLCNGTIESHHVHDFKTCGCGAAFIDGGLEYERFGYINRDDVETLFEYEQPDTREDERC